MKNRGIPVETIIELQQRLTNIPPRSPQRRKIIQEIADLYGVSEHTIYRILREKNQLQQNQRADRDTPRVMPKGSLERYCEVIAALKIRTCNRKGRHLSTVQAIRLLEEHGINTPDGHVQAPVGLLKKTTVNRYLQRWGLTTEKLSRQPPAVRFQADYSNQCWHFDLSPSDLKYLKNPSWIDESRGQPLLMLYSIVDDHLRWRCAIVVGSPIKNIIASMGKMWEPPSNSSLMPCHQKQRRTFPYKEFPR